MSVSIPPEIAFHPGLPVATPRGPRSRSASCRRDGDMRDCFAPVESNEGKQQRARLFLCSDTASSGKEKKKEKMKKRNGRRNSQFMSSPLFP